MAYRWESWHGYVAGAVLAAFGIGFFTGQGSAEVDSPIAIRSSSPDRLLSAEPAAEMVIHVVGKVKKPGLYRFSPGKRIQDAIDEAGGPASNADLDSLNLAQKLEDGVQVRVPAKGAVAMNEVEPAFGSTQEAPAQKSTSSKASRPAAKGVSLNTATSAQLDTLPGVGPSTAAKIIQYRRAHGGFASIDELLAVKGIGPKKLKDMRPYLRL